MNLILLPGNNKSNKEWIQKIEVELKDLFDSTLIQYYDHWKDNKPIIDLDLELNELVKNNNAVDVVFAKSAGILLALKAIKNHLIKPKKCIFVGFPINWARINNFDIDIWLENYQIPTMFIQNSEDPAFSFKDLREFLYKKALKNYDIVELPGNSHDYNDISKLRKLIVTFLND